ncbi:MAG TPA: hypothetical protein PK006_08795 [Saprospiraceae bacterium]|nr:hypothetical protein [Saprospiraceae bacterium]
MVNGVKTARQAVQKPNKQNKLKIKQWTNNSSVGLVVAHTDHGGNKWKIYQPNPQVDLHLQWERKTEHVRIVVPAERQIRLGNFSQKLKAESDEEKSKPLVNRFSFQSRYRKMMN